MPFRAACLSFLLLFLATAAVAEVKCVDANGEAVIVNNDLPSAKAEAIARAKWAAVEDVVGVQVKAESVVQNMAMVDEAIGKQVSGYVSSYKVLGQNAKDDIMAVRINACVEPSRAKEALSSLSLNRSIAVFIPARKPRVAREEEDIRRTSRGKSERHHLETTDEHEEANILSETVAGKLAEQGFTVVDVAPSQAVDAAEIEKAMKSGNFISLRSLMYKFLSNLLLIGKVDYTVSTAKGQDVGYGLSMPFNNVTVRLTYRLVTKDPSGKFLVLASGTEQGKGLAGNVEDATAEGLKALAEQFAPVVLEKVSAYLKGTSRKITVKVDGMTDVARSFEIREVLQNLAWVTEVEPKGLGEFVVSYPENPIYLANSISQKGMRVKKFSPLAITLEYGE